MCSRYSMNMPLNKLQGEFEEIHLNVIKTNDSDHFEPSIKILPQKTAPVYFNKESDHYCGEPSNVTPTIQSMTWGLLPRWPMTTMDLETSRSKYNTFNCRVESIAKGSPLWTSVWNQRCVIPVEGYYEDYNIDHCLVKKKGSNLTFLAGFWNATTVIDVSDYEEDECIGGYGIFTGETIYTFTVITTKATSDSFAFHERIPIIIEPGTEQWNTWLGSKEWDCHFFDVLKACKKDVLEQCEVTTDVRKVKNEKP